MSADLIAHLLMFSLLPPVHLYPLFLWYRSWRATAPGRALMVKATGAMLLIDMFTAALIFGDYLGRDFVRIFGLSIYSLGTWYLLISLFTSPGAQNYPPYTWLRRGGRVGNTSPDAWNPTHKRL